MKAKVLSVHFDEETEEFLCELKFIENPKLLVGTEIDIITDVDFENLQK